MSVAKEHLNELIQQVPDEAIPMITNLVKVFLEGMQDMERKRMQQYLDSIPYDDEPTTENDLLVFQERKDEANIDFETIKKEFGL